MKFAAALALFPYDKNDDPAETTLLKTEIMIDYIKGTLASATPTDVTLETFGIGFHILVSLQTYTAIENKIGKEALLYIHHILREDDEILYGFATVQERELFRIIIGVSGVGASTARLMLSSMSVDELSAAIAAEDSRKIQKIKGIGGKTAERIIVDLKDKMGKLNIINTASGVTGIDQGTARDAISTLVNLGYNKAAATKVVEAVLEKNPGANLEEIIKLSFKQL